MPSLSRRAWPEAQHDVGHLKALYILRSHALEQLSALLVKEGLSVLLVKGAALAATHYPIPWARPMGDIDVIVERADLVRAREALTRAGWFVVPTPDRPLTAECLEIAVKSPGELGSVLLELHLGLDKVVLRRVDVRGLFVRARVLPDLPGLRVPDAEDQTLLVALHLASDEFRHLTGFVDLELLLTSGVDLDVVIERARTWDATTSLYIALKTLDVLRPGLVAPDAVRRVAPTKLHAALLATAFDIGKWPVARSATALGWQWIVRQTLLRDDTRHWLQGLGIYGARRALERSRRLLRR